MKNSSQIILLVVLVALLGVIYYGGKHRVSNNTSTSTQKALMYACNGGKSINTIMHEGVASSVVPGEAPQPTGSVDLALSDGRSMSLKQTISADGVRYANSDESFIFWQKGNGALVLENNEQKNYLGCIKVVADPGTLPHVYQSQNFGFSLRYPEGFTIDEKYFDTNFGPGKEIYGVKFTIPSSYAQGTNLGTDSYISVEAIPHVAVGMCNASLFLPLYNGQKIVTLEEEGTTYSFASSTDAAAGNRYETSVYALPGTNPCIAVRYLIHYGVFENYPEGSVKRFDKDALLATFDQIRKTLVINQ